jgi:putative ABC transport system permease protein
MPSYTKTPHSDSDAPSSSESLAAAEARITRIQGQSQPGAGYSYTPPPTGVRRLLHKLAGQIHFVVMRQWHHPGLTLLALWGVILAVGLVTSATFFSDAVERVILGQKLAEFSEMTGRPPFSTSIYIFPSTRQPLSLAGAEEVASHLAGTLSSEVGLPLQHLGVQVSSGGMMLQPGEESSLYGEEQSFLGSISLVYVADIKQHMDIVSGEPLDDVSSGEVLDVWMHARLAEKMGVNVGEEFHTGVTLSDATLPLRVKGIWQSHDPTDRFWFSHPDDTLKDDLLVRRQDYVTHIEPLVSAKTRQANWHIILDESKVEPANARGYVAGFDRGMAIINKYLPGARLNAPPLDPLVEFVRRETTLTILLLSFNVPAFGFLLYFMILTSAIIVRWQRRDTAILVSRGMSISGALGLTLIEELLLFVLGYPLGIGFGMLLGRFMGYASSFLSFASRSPLPVSLKGTNFPLTLLVLVVALIARLWPALQAARQSVVEEERERARPQRAPFWYRHYLDFLILLPTVYAYRQLADKGTLTQLVQDRPEDVYRDPLLILVPALFILTAALMTLRVFPLVMRVIDRLAGWLPWTTPYLALRRLSRQSQGYINPLLLMIVSLGLGVYTLSMAASLDQWLVDRMYYRVGTDLAFEPYPLSVDGPFEMTDGLWIPLPDEFRQLPGVIGASRVGDYFMEIDIPGGDEIRGRFLAIDRTDFPSVAWFRRDLAEESLGSLMNRLALTPDGILVSEQSLKQSPLQIGDQIGLYVGVNNQLSVASPFTIVGTYKYFPTVYEENRLTVIGNMDFLSTLIGIPLPHSIWLRIGEEADGQTVLNSVTQTGVDVHPIRRQDTRAIIKDEQAKTERVGIFGTLSVSFLAAAVMAAIGLLMNSYASLQERLYRFAIWRAIGLMRRQIIGQVILEYTLLTTCGALAGAVIGVQAAEFFVPFFRVTGEQGMPLPPLLPLIAQQDIRQLALSFVVIMLLLEVVVIARSLSWRHYTLLRGRGG